MTNDIKNIDPDQQNVQKSNYNERSLWHRVQSAGRWLSEGFTKFCRSYPNTAFLGGVGTLLVGNAVSATGIYTQSYGSNPLMAAFAAAGLGVAATWTAMAAIDVSVSEASVTKEAPFASNLPVALLAGMFLGGVSYSVTSHINDLKEMEQRALFLMEQYYEASHVEKNDKLTDHRQAKFSLERENPLIELTPGI